MKWTKPTSGDIRIKEGFLIFPKELQDELRMNVVTKWMEWASWVECYTLVGYSVNGQSVYKWKPIYWIEK